MTPVYEVKTVHTKKVLKDFVTFTYLMKNPAMTAMIIVFAACFYTLAYIGRDRPALYIPCIILGTIVFLFALLRKYIAVGKLAKADPNFQNQTVIHLTFGEKEFTVEDAGQSGVQHLKYAEIAFIYADNEYYYISVNNEMIHMIPKGDFITGTSEEFYQFISNKTGKEIRPTKIPWKTRIQLMLEYRDAKAEARIKEQQEKRKK